MRKNFTKLACVGIACFCMVSALAQENKPAVGVIEEKVFPQKKGIELRAAGDEKYFWPDSLIRYNNLGKPTSKTFYDEENRTEISATWEDDNWIYDEPLNSDGFLLFQPKFEFRGLSSTDIPSIRIWNISTVAIVYNDYPATYNTIYDSEGNLIVLELTPKGGPPEVAATYRLNYNRDNNLVLVEAYWYDNLHFKYQYEYNENGYCVLYKGYIVTNNTIVIENIEYNKFDEKDRLIEQHFIELSSMFSSYKCLYYSDGENIPNVEVENNNSIGNNNQGSFDVNVNIPIDSISNCSITITFPEGFTLDDKNTSLTLDFADLFDLIITKQDNNSWLFEIKPKTLKSASLRADEVTKMLQVAYTVDEKLLRGTYDISVNSILFESKGGNYIPEPAITVPVQLNRWGVSNVKVESNNIWASGGNLYIRTDKTCTLSVFTVYGQLFKQQTISAGETIIPLPQGIYFVKVEDTTKKIIAK